LITALQVLAVMRRTGRSLRELAQPMPQLPQELINVRVAKRIDVDGHPAIREAVRDAEEALGNRGRVVLRPSGTEPVVRVMVEGDDAETVRSLALRLADSVRAAID